MNRALLFLVIVLAALTGSASLVQEKTNISFGSYGEVLTSANFFQSADTVLSKDTIQFVGDVLLSRHVETLLDAYGSDYVYSKMPPVSSSTILVGNFEASIPVDHVHTPDLTFNFSVDPQHLNALHKYGFNYLGLSNNHTYDNGLAGFQNTVFELTKNNMKPFGDPSTLGTSSVSYIQLQDAIVAIVALYAVVGEPDLDKLQVLLEQASVSSDFQVAYIHWGTEYELTHSKFQQTLSYRLIDLGVDVIIGHHPHVVQDIEIYKDGLIFYSLGNFIFDQYFSDDVQQGLMVSLSVENRVLQLSLTGVTSVGSRSVPQIMNTYDQDIFLNNLAKRSHPGLRSMIQDGIITQ